MQWHAISDANFRFRSWDGEVVVYNLLSGDTHLLGFAAAEILSRLQCSPSDARSLAQSLASSLGTVPDDTLIAQTEHILADLNALELIERLIERAPS